MLGGIIHNDIFEIDIGSYNTWSQSVNLRNAFDAIYPGVAASGTVKVIFTQKGNIGASNNNGNTAALYTGTWLAGSEITLIVPSNNGSESSPQGFILGNGGSAARGTPAGNAISLQYNLTIVNHGIIGGGGGAGADHGGPDGNGGGGAGYPPGFSVEGSGPGHRMYGGGGSGGSGWGGGLGMIGGCASYCPGDAGEPLVKNGYTLTFDSASTHTWFAGTRARVNVCDPVNNPAHRRAPY